MEGKPLKFKINSFYNLANQYRQKITEEQELEKIDMTQHFWKEVEYMIQHNELVNINVNGRVRMGKSTEAIAIGMQMFDLLKKHGFRKKDDVFTMKNVARDQQEYSKKMRNPETAFTVIVTDESNNLEGTGENVTVENALSQDFSDVQAGRYVHRVSCSPKNVIDGNADILLEIIGADRRSMISHNRLYYRYTYGGIEYRQLLGYVNIYVGDSIHP